MQSLEMMTKARQIKVERWEKQIKISENIEPEYTLQKIPKTQILIGSTRDQKPQLDIVDYKNTGLKMIVPKSRKTFKVIAIV